MDGAWHNLSYSYGPSNANHETAFPVGAGSNVASTGGAASTSNLCNNAAASKRERDKEYKNKSRQKQADEKALLDLKVTRKY